MQSWPVQHFLLLLINSRLLWTVKATWCRILRRRWPLFLGARSPKQQRCDLLAILCASCDRRDLREVVQVTSTSARLTGLLCAKTLLLQQDPGYVNLYRAMSRISWWTDSTVMSWHTFQIEKAYKCLSAITQAKSRATLDTVAYHGPCHVSCLHPFCCFVCGCAYQLLFTNEIYQLL